jgi:PAS domain S-box-containing protein
VRAVTRAAALSSLPTHGPVLAGGVARPPLMKRIRARFDPRHLASGSIDSDFLSAAVESVDDPIVTTTPSFVITSWNPAAERLYGLRAEETLGRGLVEAIVPPERAEEVCAVTERVLAGERVDNYDTEHHCRGGRRIDVSVTTSSIRDARGAVIGLCTIIRDVTGRRRRQRQLLQDVQRYSWLQRIRLALDEDRFELHLQPIVDLQTGQVAREEALLRMSGGEGDPATPAGEFLHVAEAFDLMREIDRWVVERIAPLLSNRPALELNISEQSIAADAVTERVENLLRSRSRDSGTLTVEIADGVAARDLKATRRFADRLTELGGEFALDDFGIEPGGLARMRELPVSYVKIDSNLVGALTRGKSDRDLIRSLVDTAHGCGVKAIAEGVEREDTAGELRRIGVDYGQGFLFGVPAAA